MLYFLVKKFKLCLLYLVLIVWDNFKVLIILFVDGLNLRCLYFVLMKFILNEVLCVMNIVLLIYFLNFVSIFLILGVFINILLVICVKLIIVFDNCLCGLLNFLNLLMILLLWIFIVVSLMILLYWFDKLVVLMLNII